jgi:gluconolactonase
MEPVVPIEQLEVFANGLDHAEGIAVTPDGTLYVGGEAGQLYRIEPDDTFTELLTTGGFMLGLAADAEGRIYACDIAAKCVWRINPETKERTVFTKGTDDRGFTAPNWGCFDANGNYYLSDSGDWKAAAGLIWVVRPGGRTQVWTEESRNFPNGMALAPDGSQLYVLESTPGALVSFAINEDGSAGPREVLSDLPGAVPDGVAVAKDGSLIIACYRPDVIYQWHPDYGVRVFAEDPEGVAIAAPTNVVFVGPELDTIVVPNIGRWHLTRIRAGIAGEPLFYPTREQLGA